VADRLESATAQPANYNGSGTLSSEICLDLPVGPADPAEIYRYLGYPAKSAPAPRVAQRIASIVEQARRSLRPRGTYAVYAVTHRTAHSLKLDATTISGNIGEYLEHAERVAVFAVSVGSEISRLSESAAKSGDTFSAWAMDAVGSWAVEEAADALMVRIRRHLQDGQELTLRYSPGYCGMDISQQQNLFQLIQADSVGVTLMPSMLMQPLKSISGLVGLTPKDAVNSYHSPCDLCPRTGCHMRR